jgi:hypothetical protein
MILRRLRSQAGHTLMELVVAMSLGMGILLISFALLDRSLSLSSEVSQRVDALQHGRLAMDTITRQLRSQVCLGKTNPVAGAPAIYDGLVEAKDDSVTFYSNLSAYSVTGTIKPPEKHTIAYDSVTGKITQTSIKGNLDPPLTQFTALPRKNVLLDNAARNGASPIFSYYGFDATVPPKPQKLFSPTPLSSTDREQTARIVISFVSRPTRAKTTTKRAAVLTDEIFVRSADPNDPAPVPKCA